jgi:2'-5' RNA ligase
VVSLNVPVPAPVRERIASLRPALSGFETVREEPTLVLKRFDGSVPDDAIQSEVRLALADATPFEVRLDGIGSFETPVTGPGPVAYLAVESPGLERFHGRLVDAFGAVDGLEGADYVPHVTLARGGGMDALDPLETVSVEPVEWTVAELWFWDARRGERLGQVSLRG